MRANVETLAEMIIDFMMKLLLTFQFVLETFKVVNDSVKRII